MKERITLDDNLMTAIMKMSGGNPGAVTALAEIASATPTIDPDDAFGAIGPILGLDTHGIYESEIWQLYSDVCDRDVVKVLTLLRGVQLGVLAESDLKRAIRGNNGYGSADVLPITFAECVKGVREICPRFAAGTEF